MERRQGRKVHTRLFLRFTLTFGVQFMKMQTLSVNIICSHETLFKKNKFEGHTFFCRATDAPVFEFLVMFPLGGGLVIHLLTSWQSLEPI